MTTKRITVVVLGAMAAHYGLSRLLASAATFAEAREERDLAPHHPVPRQRVQQPSAATGVPAR
jgi:hypothetical protein